MIRAMFLDYPNDYTLGTATRYQFLYGPSILVAPVYQKTQADEKGNDVRHAFIFPKATGLIFSPAICMQADGSSIVLTHPCGNSRCS